MKSRDLEKWKRDKTTNLVQIYSTVLRSSLIGSGESTFGSALSFYTTKMTFAYS